MFNVQMTLHYERNLRSSLLNNLLRMGTLDWDEIYALRSTTAWVHWPDMAPTQAQAAINMEARYIQRIYDSNKALTLTL
jgi:hypothetical protein